MSILILQLGYLAVMVTIAGIVGTMAIRMTLHPTAEQLEESE